MANSMEHKNEVNISVQNGSDPIQLLLHNPHWETRPYTSWKFIGYKGTSSFHCKQSN